MTYVSHQQPAGYEARDHKIVTIGIDIFFGVQKTESDMIVALQILAGIALHKGNEAFNLRQFKGLARQFHFFGQHFEGGD
jgi:hypothetical protein